MSATARLIGKRVQHSSPDRLGLLGIEKRALAQRLHCQTVNVASVLMGSTDASADAGRDVLFKGP